MDGSCWCQYNPGQIEDDNQFSKKKDFIRFGGYEKMHFMYFEFNSEIVWVLCLENNMTKCRHIFVIGRVYFIIFSNDQFHILSLFVLQDIFINLC